MNNNDEIYLNDVVIKDEIIKKIKNATKFADKRKH
jgi:hypothetical protein